MSAWEFVTIENLYQSTRFVSRDKIAVYADLLRKSCTLFPENFNSREKICHFLAQIHHESGEYQFVEEIASGADYEYRADLGNFFKGDGVKYKGRGLIQLTGRYNYQYYGKLLGLPLVEKPWLLTEPVNACKVSVFFWVENGLSDLAVAGNFEAITRRINGGLNGLGDRLEYLRRAMNAYDRWRAKL